jgi:hypothetical protein
MDYTVNTFDMGLGLQLGKVCLGMLCDYKFATPWQLYQYPDKHSMCQPSPQNREQVYDSYHLSPEQLMVLPLRMMDGQAATQFLGLLCRTIGYWRDLPRYLQRMDYYCYTIEYEQNPHGLVYAIRCITKSRGDKFGLSRRREPSDCPEQPLALIDTFRSFLLYCIEKGVHNFCFEMTEVGIYQITAMQEGGER